VEHHDRRLVLGDPDDLVQAFHRIDRAAHRRLRHHQQKAVDRDDLVVGIAAYRSSMVGSGGAVGAAALAVVDEGCEKRDRVRERRRRDIECGCPCVRAGDGEGVGDVGQIDFGRGADDFEDGGARRLILIAGVGDRLTRLMSDSPRVG
jgi:hypothetical protein